MLKPRMQFVPPFIAHRGANAVAPENTLAAFLRAKELGAKWIEFDVTLAACGEAVVMHDDTLDRTTDGSGLVSERTYSYIKTLDAGSWFGLEFAGERVPTFKEVIAFLQQHELAANVEIKALPGQEAFVAKKILADIQQHWTVDSMLPPLISSFSIPVLQHVQRQAPGAMIAVLIHEWFSGWEEVCHALSCTSVNLSEKIVTADAIQTIKAMDKVILSYTVNTVRRAEELFSLGVDALFTDEFEELKHHFSIS